ncbi:deoxycytidylate deaminase-like [Tubulanus polymorphus]|uniref:deoxycytidylate deaminase-like n=1 Tax=Tubulanus polymorphus TaxID=672921 RepID=UPI003DA3A396
MASTSSETACKSQKRDDYISWDEWHMGIAILSAQRSKDPVFQVGACVVNEENKIMGVGYNGMPLNCPDDKMSWGKEGAILDTKKYFVCHAEMNAITFRNCASLKGCRIYQTFFPCNECAKMIIQSKIVKVIYLHHTKQDRDEYKASKMMLEEADIEVVKYDELKGNKHKEITLKFA